jgi:hypothetical protein
MGAERDLTVKMLEAMVDESSVKISTYDGGDKLADDLRLMLDFIKKINNPDLSRLMAVSLGTLVTLDPMNLIIFRTVMKASAKTLMSVITRVTLLKAEEVIGKDKLDAECDGDCANCEISPDKLSSGPLN